VAARARRLHLVATGAFGQLYRWRPTLSPAGGCTTLPPRRRLPDSR